MQELVSSCRMVGSMNGDTPAGVIDAGLWERVSAAFPAVNAAIDQYLAAGGWVPSASVPVMAQFDISGWPHMQFPAAPGSDSISATAYGWRSWTRQSSWLAPGTATRSGPSRLSWQAPPRTRSSLPA